MNKIKIMIHKPLGGGLKPDTVVEVQTDKHGTPLEQFWRKRLKDSERDGCCTVVGSNEQKKKKTTEKKEKET